MDKYNEKMKDIYLTAEEINKMYDDELVGVSRIAINSRITELQIQGSEDTRALKILKKASDEIREREKRFRSVVLWGVKMTVKDVKIAFGDLTKYTRVYFKKV